MGCICYRSQIHTLLCTWPSLKAHLLYNNLEASVDQRVCSIDWRVVGYTLDWTETPRSNQGSLIIVFVTQFFQLDAFDWSLSNWYFLILLVKAFSHSLGRMKDAQSINPRLHPFQLFFLTGFGWSLGRWSVNRIGTWCISWTDFWA